MVLLKALFFTYDYLTTNQFYEDHICFGGLETALEVAGVHSYLYFCLFILFLFFPSLSLSRSLFRPLSRPLSRSLSVLFLLLSLY